MEATSTAALMAASAGLAHGFKPLIDEGAKLIDLALGGPAEALGDALKARIREWDFTKRVAAAGKAKLLLDEHKIPIRNVPPEFMLPMLSAAADSGSEDVHDLVAKLLASGIAEPFYQHPMFRYVATQLTADEARILEFWGNGGEISLYNMQYLDTQRVYLQNHPQTLHLIAKDRISFYAENLKRLGICAQSSQLHVAPADVPRGVFEQTPRGSVVKERYKSTKPTDMVFRERLQPNQAGAYLAAVASLKTLRREKPSSKEGRRRAGNRLA